ncbi:MAG: hypothetical protein WBX22_01575 [Silvibacterium sp.]
MAKTDYAEPIPEFDLANPATRDPEAAIKELHDCLIAVNATMQVLAKMFPGTTLITGFGLGQPCSTLAFARSREADHFSPSAMDAAKTLARIVVAMLPELQEVFLIELQGAAEIRQIRAEMEQARAEALRAAAEGTGSD